MAIKLKDGTVAKKIALESERAITFIKAASGKVLWHKGVTLTISSDTGVESLSVRRTSAPTGQGTIGTVSNNATVYYGDVLVASPEAKRGYDLDYYPSSYTVGSSNLNIAINTTKVAGTVGFAVTQDYGYWVADSSSGQTVTSELYVDDKWAWDETSKIFTITHNGAQQKVAFKMEASTAQWKYTYTGIEFGDLPAGAGTVTTSNWLTHFGNIKAKVTKELQEYTITFKGTDYGTWDDTSATALYGDKIQIGNQVAICYKGDTEERRWIHYLNEKDKDAQYTYSAWVIGNDFTVTDNATIDSRSSREVNYYTVVLTSTGDTRWAKDSSVTPTLEFNVPYGTKWSTSGNKLTCGTYQYTFSGPATDAQYTRVTSLDYPSGTVTGDTTITASTTQTLRYYDITFQTPTYGSWNSTETINVAYGTKVLITGNTVTINDKIRTLSANAMTPQYSYSASVTSSTFSVTGATEIKTTSSRTVRQYKISFNDTNYGTWNSNADITVDYGTEVAISGGNTVKIGSTIRTLSPLDATAQYTYSASITTASFTVTGNKAIATTSGRTVNKYTISFEAPTYGSWNSTTAITGVEYGTTVTINDSYTTLTVGSVTRTYTKPANTAQYTYYGEINATSFTLTGDRTITVDEKREINWYDITFKSAGGAKWSTGGSTGETTGDVTYNVPYGSTWSTSGTTVTLKCDRTISLSYINPTRTQQYTYNTSLSASTGTVTGTTTVTATATATTNKYNITFSNPTYGSWDSTATISADYGSSVTISGNTLTVNGITRTLTKTADTAQYSYSASITSTSFTLTDNTAIQTTSGRVVNKYKISFQTTNYGTWNSTAQVTVDYGTRVTISGNTATIGSVATRTLTTKTTDAQYTYSSSITSTTFDVTGNATIATTSGRTLRSYTASTDATEYGSWSDATDATVWYGDYLEVSGNTVTCRAGGSSGTARWSKTYNAPQSDAQYTYQCGLSMESRTVDGDEYLAISEARFLNYYTLKFTATGGATWSATSSASKTTLEYNVPYGTTWSTSGTSVSVRNGLIANLSYNNPSTTAQYTYSTSLDKTSGTVTGDVTVTATATPTLRYYNISFSNPTYGSWNATTAISAAYGSNVTISGNQVTIGSTTRTLSATAGTTQYSYSAWITSSSFTVTGNATIGVNSSRTTNKYTISFSNPTYGSWNSTSGITAEYGTQVTISGNTVTIGSSSRTLSAAATTAQYSYSAWITSTTFSISGNATIGVNSSRTLRSYTASVASVNYGSWDSWADATVYYGDYLYVNGNTVTCKAGGSSGSARWSRTYTKPADTAQYSYSGGVTNTSGTITGNITLSADCVRTRLFYTVTLNTSGGATWSAGSTGASGTITISVEGGTRYSVSGLTLTVGASRFTANNPSTTAQYTYSTSIGATSGTITSNTTITATATPTTRYYNVGFSNPTYGSWDSTSAVSVPYGTSVTLRGNTATVGSTTRTLSANSATTQYIYSAWITTSSFTVTGAATIQTSSSRSVRGYTISFTNPSYGYWDASSKTAYYGDTISSNGYTITCYQGTSGSVRWTNSVHANTATAEYSYNAWVTSSSVPSSCTGAATITAGSDRYVQSYKVNFIAYNGSSEGGGYVYTSSSSTYLTNVELNLEYGATIARSGSTLTITKRDGSVIKIYSIAESTAYTTYSFSDWKNEAKTSSIPTSGTTITGKTTFYSIFSGTTRYYTITLSKAGSNAGSWDYTSVSVPAGGSYSLSPSYSGRNSKYTLIVRNSAGAAFYTRTFTNSTHGSGSTLQYYNVIPSSYSASGITSNRTITMTTSW